MVVLETGVPGAESTAYIGVCADGALPGTGPAWPVQRRVDAWVLHDLWHCHSFRVSRTCELSLVFVR